MTDIYCHGCHGKRELKIIDYGDHENPPEWGCRDCGGHRWSELQDVDPELLEHTTYSGAGENSQKTAI